MKNSFAAFILLAFVTMHLSCSEKTVVIPPEIIKPEEMVPILVDFQIAQSSLTIFEYTDTLTYSLNDYQQEILRKNNLTEEKYNSSMKFYASHPEMLQKIYDEVINELSKQQGELELDEK